MPDDFLCLLLLGGFLGGSSTVDSIVNGDLTPDDFFLGLRRSMFEVWPMRLTEPKEL